VFDGGKPGIVSWARGFLVCAKDGLADPARKAARSLGHRSLSSLLFFIKGSELLRNSV